MMNTEQPARQQRLWVIAGITFAITAFMLSEFAREFDNFQELERVKLPDAGHHIHDDTEQFFDKYASMLRTIAESSCAREGDNARHCSQFFERLTDQSSNIVNFAATDRAGIYIASDRPFDREHPPSVKSTAFFKEMSAGKPLFVINPHLDPLSGERVTGLVIPLLNTSGQFDGLILVSIWLKQLELFWQQTFARQHVSALILDRNKKIVSATPDLALLLENEAIGRAVAKAVSVGDSDKVEIDGTPFFFHTKRSKVSEWLVVTLLPGQGALLRFIFAKSWPISLTVGVLLLVCLALILLRREQRFINRLVATEGALRAHSDNLESQVASRTSELRKSEQNFRNLFENAEFSICNKDLSEVANALAQLRQEGVTDLRKYLADRPQLVCNMAEMVRVTQVNEATLRLFGAKTEEQFIYRIAQTFGPGAIEVFTEQLCAIWDGKRVFRAEADFRTLDGKEIKTIISFRIPETLAGFRSIPVGTFNITDLKQAEQQVRTLSQAIEQSPVSVLITDPDGNIEYVNRTFERISGYCSAEVMGKNPKILQSASPPKCGHTELWKAISNGEAWDGEFKNRKKSGEIFWEHAQIAPVLDQNGAICNYLVVEEDITLRKQQEDHILHQAHFDGLTDLPNRFLALDRLTQLLNEAKRNNELVAVLFMDLDDFKKINDTLGHDVGDKLLIEAAGRLRHMIRSGDSVGRLGGDEFIVLLGGLADATDSRLVVDNLLNSFRAPFIIDSRELILTASIGIAIYPADGDNTSVLLRNADTAMYRAKEQGRNSYCYFTDSMNRDVSRRLALEEQMHGALERGEFKVFYQSQIEVSSGKTIGAEALLNWHNPALGHVPPDEFIPVAEKTGLIIALGKFVLTEALAMAATWQQAYFPDFRMAVNLSPRQFHDKTLVNFIEQALRKHGISSGSLELEITEGVLMSGHSYIDEALAALSSLGVHIAMDDFGTGYSSLSYLRSYPFDVIKIDRSFINDITVDPADRLLINAAIVMAHALGLKVVAEGVETQEQLSYLKDLSCDYAQGYLFSRAMPAVDLAKWVCSPRVKLTQVLEFDH